MQATEPSRDWSLQLRGGAHIGAAAMASRTRASVELRDHHGQSTLLAFLDCSKCYERVGHAVAGSRARISGLRGGGGGEHDIRHVWGRQAHQGARGGRGTADWSSGPDRGMRLR